MACASCPVSAPNNPAVPQFYVPSQERVTLGMPPGLETANPYRGFQYPMCPGGGTDCFEKTAYNPQGTYGGSPPYGPQDVYSQQYVSPQLGCGTRDLTSATLEPVPPLCAKGHCGPDFGFVCNDVGTLAVLSLIHI